MLDELEWPSFEARRDRSSLLLFHKIHSGALSIEKDKYLTPAHSLRTTRSSHSARDGVLILVLVLVLTRVLFFQYLAVLCT